MADDFDGLFDLAVETYEKLTAQVEVETPLERPLACKPGCGMCCYQPAISVTPIEVFFIANYIRENFSEEQVADLQKALENPEHRLEYGGLQKCPLLQDQKCSIYDARPFACRSANSYDLGACENAARNGRKGNTVPTYQGHLSATQLVLDALYKAIAENKLENNLFDLRRALAIVLKNPNADKTWRKGREVFGADALPKV